MATTVGAELAVGGTSPERVDGLLEQFHLTAHRDHHPLTLSGGQARRLSVATMVSEERDVVVLDEPTYGQDWDNTCELMDFIDQLCHQGRTVIMATHDLELALEHCTHIVALPGAAGTGAADSRAGLPEPAPVPTRPQPRRGLFTSLNPFTLFASVLPVMVMVFALRNHHLNLGILLTSSVLIVAARASLRRTVASVVAPWVVAALMTWIFSSGVHHQETAARLYDLGDAVTGGTGIGALIALVLVSGVSTDPEALIRTLTTTFHMPYRLGAAGTAAIAFITRLCPPAHRQGAARGRRPLGDVRARGPLDRLHPAADDPGHPARRARRPVHGLTCLRRPPTAHRDDRRALERTRLGSRRPDLGAGPHHLEHPPLRRQPCLSNRCTGRVTRRTQTSPSASSSDRRDRP